MPKFLFSYKVILFLLLLLKIQCSLSRKNEIFNKPPEETTFDLFQRSKKIALKVSNTHKEKLHAIQNEEFTASEAEELFEELHTSSSDICKMYFKYIEYDPKKVEQFSTGLKFNRGPKEKWFDNLLSPLMAGCFNFFRMNDRNINITFSKMRKFINEEADCYSVGFLQPYLLHSTIGCKELIMIDVDWRIIYTHLKLLQKFEEEKFKDLEVGEQNKILSDLPIAWVARFDKKPTEEEREINIKTFCAYSEMSYCKEIFIKFQYEFPKIHSVQLQLSLLHEASIQPRIKNTIIFTSNALDKEYTTKTQLESFLDSMFSKLEIDKNIFIIYQVGGMKEFGIYKLYLDTKKNRKIETVCRDEYKLSDEYKHKGKKYYINLDKKSSTKFPPRCQ